MKLFIATLVLALSQTSYASFLSRQVDGEVAVWSDSAISMYLKDASHYTTEALNKDNLVTLSVTTNGQIIGTVGLWLSYSKGHILENGQKAHNKKMVLAEANHKVQRMCLAVGGRVISIGQQVAKSGLRVPAGEFYRLYDAYSEVSCDLTNKSTEVLSKVDTALKSATAEETPKLLQLRSYLSK